MSKHLPIEIRYGIKNSNKRWHLRSQQTKRSSAQETHCQTQHLTVQYQDQYFTGNPIDRSLMVHGI